jgi:hypothetical protein
MRRADLRSPGESRVAAVVPPEPAPIDARLAWASAVGNQQVQRIARAHASEEDVEEAGYEPIEWLPGLEEDEAEELAEETEPPGAVLARKPAGTARRAKGPAPTADDVADVVRVAARVRKQLPDLERERSITSLEASELEKMIDWFVNRAKERRPGERATIRRDLNGLRKLPAQVRSRAADARSTKGKSLISDFRITPPAIRVEEGEAARISFVLGDRVKSVQAYIIDHGGRFTYMKEFAVRPTPGFHQAIWDGTFEGRANQPPKAGTYRLEVSVGDGAGRSERVSDQIRVENPGGETVLPRVGSGREISTLHFDGRTFTLTDAATDPADTSSDSIQVPATSGMKIDNPRNTEKKDFTDPKHQWVPNRGPIPAGHYTIKAGHYQVPDADRKGATYASGGTAAKWGPMRVQIEPNTVKNRSEFFIHMDVTNDGTAGCIGIPPAYEGKFNQIMSLIATSKKEIKLFVVYP